MENNPILSLIRLLYVLKVIDGITRFQAERSVLTNLREKRKLKEREDGIELAIKYGRQSYYRDREDVAKFKM